MASQMGSSAKTIYKTVSVSEITNKHTLQPYIDLQAKYANIYMEYSIKLCNYRRANNERKAESNFGHAGEIPVWSGLHHILSAQTENQPGLVLWSGT